MSRQQVGVYRSLRRLKGYLNHFELSRLAIIREMELYIKQKWFSELYDPSIERVSVNLLGLKLSLPRRFVDHYVFREYEPVTCQVFMKALRPGMVVIDVGAHIGYYTLLAARKVGASGKVHAVEPDLGNLNFLRENVLLNSQGNIEIHPYAAGGSHGARAFHVTGSSDSHGFYPHPHTHTVQMIEVAQVPLDGLVKGKAHVVKIDVEGAEIEVLEGMSRILAENERLSLMIEWNPACMRNAGYDPLDLPAYLNKRGFQTVQVLDDRAMRMRSIDEVQELVRSGNTPHFWHVNLWAKRG